MRIICTTKECDMLYELFLSKCDSSLYSQCKIKDTLNINNCFDCITYCNNIEWNIVKK